MRIGLSFRADRRIQDQVDSLDAVAMLLTDMHVEISTRFTFGDFDFLYFVTDEVGAGAARAMALITGIHPVSVERI